MVSLNINFQKKDLWLLSAIVVFLIGVGFVIATNGQTPLWQIHGHSSGEVEGINLGSWTDKDNAGNALKINKVYKITGNGFISVPSSPFGTISLYNDQNSNGPTYLIAQGAVSGGAPRLTSPVKGSTESENYYIRLDHNNDGSATSTILWIPVGDSEIIFVKNYP